MRATQGKKVDGPPLREGDRGKADPRPDQPIRGRVSAPRTDREETWRLPEASDKTARTHGAESSAPSHQWRQIGGRDSSLRICVPIRCGREGDRAEREVSVGHDECMHRRICAARPMRPGTDYPSSAACDDRNVQRRPVGGALASTSRPCVRDRNPNGRRPGRGFGSRPLRRVEPRPEGQRAQPNPLEKCVHTRYMFPRTWKDFGGFGGRDPDDADDGE